MFKILREADRPPVAEVATKHAVSEQTLYLWHKRDGQLDAADVKPLRSLQQENERIVSPRRACALLGVARSTLGCLARMPQMDAP